MSNETIRIRPFHRAPIRRAAVTGLFALWLAPLAAEAQGRATALSPSECCEVEPAGRVEQPATKEQAP